MKFVLASASPARKRLLASSGIEPIVVAGSFDEDAVPFEAPESYVETLARGKAQHVISESARLPAGPFLLLACDSVLIFEGQLARQTCQSRTGSAPLAGHARQDGLAVHRPFSCKSRKCQLAVTVEKECTRIVRTDVSFVNAS
jgi:hypothetical protein